MFLLNWNWFLDEKYENGAIYHSLSAKSETINGTDKIFCFQALMQIFGIQLANEDRVIAEGCIELFVSTSEDFQKDDNFQTVAYQTSKVCNNYIIMETARCVKIRRKVKAWFSARKIVKSE